MKIERLLAKARKCTTEDCAKDLLIMLQRVFGRARPLAKLIEANGESSMEGGRAYARFELNRVISGSYITAIQPEIRDDKLVVAISTARMPDGAGMGSQSWETVEDLGDLIECEPEQTVLEIARKAKTLALAQHQFLIEQVGLPSKDAEQAARKSW